jgi:cytoskeletal protein RodZ
VLGDPDSRIDYDLARAAAHAAAANPRRNNRRWGLALAAMLPLAGIFLLTLFVYQPFAGENVSQVAAMPAPKSAPNRPERQAVSAAAATEYSDEGAETAETEPREYEVLTPGPEPTATNQPRAQADPAKAIKLAVAPASVPIATAPQRVAAEPAEEAKSAPSCGDRSGGIAAVCNSAAVAGLDRSLGVLFRQSVQRADKSKQASLYRDHDRFVARLNACSSEACARREYLARMQEVSATMSAPPPKAK